MAGNKEEGKGRKERDKHRVQEGREETGKIGTLFFYQGRKLRDKSKAPPKK